MKPEQATYLHVYRSGICFQTNQKPTISDYGSEARLAVVGVFIFQDGQFCRLDANGIPVVIAAK